MSSIASFNAQLIFDSQARLGEGPVWDHHHQYLYWVDIEGCALHRHNPKTLENKNWVFGEMIGSFFPTTRGCLVLSLESGMFHLDLKTDQSTPLHLLENSDKEMRFNDGKCDPYGNLWVGTMHKKFKSATGSLYKVSKNLDVRKMISGTTISNGMAWSPDRSTFYFIDSPTYTVCAYDYDQNEPQISNKRILFSIPESYGAPDGMTIDQEGMLWVAHWGGNCVRRWNPATGTVLSKVHVPAPQVTSCCFGGEHLNSLYITTARGGLSPEQLKQFPLSGGLFCIETEVSGLPITYFNQE